MATFADDYQPLEAAPEYMTYFHVERKRVKDFIGREPQLLKITSYFSPRDDSQRKILILHALGGQGKSQLALEYCRRSTKTYRGIFWINANSEATTTQSFVKISTVLSKGISTGLDNAQARIRYVNDTLAGWRERWLLVFDNYDRPDEFPGIERFIPSGEHGDILFTTRNNSLERLGTLLEIPPMTTEEGVSLLLYGYDDQDIQQHAVAGSRIVARLGGLALAIDQAAAYIKYKRMPLNRLGEFLTTFDTEAEKILKYIPKHFWEYGTMQIHDEAERNKAISAFTTWEMSFQQLEPNDERRKSEVAHFLTLSAFFNPANIAESLFRHYWEAEATRPEWMHIFSTTDDEESDDEISSDRGASGHEDGCGQRKDTWGSEQFWDLIAKSYELSLLQSISSRDGQKDASFSLHPLIRDWLQLREKTGGRRKYTREGIDVVLSCVKWYETVPAAPDHKRLLMAHMDACLSNDARFSQPQPMLGHDIASCHAASWFASFYQDQGHYEASEGLARLTVETRTTMQGEEHPDTLTSMNNLAEVLRDQGKYKEAEERHRWTLKLTETVLGKKHPDTLASMNNLALMLNDQGKCEEAEEMLRRTLKLTETVLGKEHPNTLISMNNLAEMLSDHGKYKEVKEMHQRINYVHS